MSCYRIGDISLNGDSLTLTRGDRSVHLTHRAVDVLLALGSGNGEPLGREELMKSVWQDVVVDEAALKQYVYMLRGAFRELHPELEYIETVPRCGYRLTLPILAEPLPSKGSGGNGAKALGAGFEPTAAQLGSDAGASVVVPGQSSVRSWLRMKAWRIAVGVTLLAALVSGGRVLWQKQRADQLIEEGFHQLRTNRTFDLGAISDLFGTALKYNPKSAHGYAGLAQTMARNNKRFQRHALEMAQRSLELDPNCGRCLSTYGWILLTREWKWTEARDALARGAQREPEFLEGRIWRAQWLASTRRFEEAKQEIDTAVKLAPALAAPYAMRAGIFYLSGEYQKAIDEGGRTLGIQPRFNAAYDWMFRSSIMLGSNEDVLVYWSWHKASFLNLSMEGQMQDVQRMLEVYRTNGLPGIVATLLEETSIPPGIETQRYQRAVWQMWNSSRAGALEELRAAAEAKPFHLIYLAADPVFQPLRSDPQFQQLLDRLGITPHLSP